MKTLPVSVRAAALALSAALLASPAVLLAQAAPASGDVVTRTVGTLVMQNVPETPADVRERLIQYNNTRSAGFAGFTPDGGILITTRFAETAQVHAVATPGGARTQLTFFPERIAGAQVLPRSSDFLFVKDEGGNELFQAFRFDRASGRSIRLSEPGTRNEGASISRDGRTMAWAVTRPGTPRRDIVVMNPADPASRRTLMSRDGGWSVLDISEDGTRLLLGEYVSVTHTRRAVLDIESGGVTDVTPQLTVAYDGGAFSQDGRSAFLVTDEGSEFAYVVRVDLASGQRTRVSPVTSWDVDSMALSPDGRTIAYSVNEDGMSRLYLMSTRPGARPEAVSLPIGTLGGLDWAPDSARLGFSLSTASAPGDAFTLDVRSRRLTRWTTSEIGGLDPSAFVEPRLIRYPTFDADPATGSTRTIPAFVYQPASPGPHPSIILIHGGPEAQSRPGFSSQIQYWVNELGIAVIVPNVRGSTGYGKTFVSLDNGMKREDSVKDIGALLDWIATQPQLDAGRVAVYGGSYGGYMVLASMVHFGERLVGGVDIVGISNFVTFLQNTEGYRRDLRRVEYGDERDPAMRAHLEAISPLTNAGRINRPLFVIQGANDPRVPRSEAEQIVERVRANGGKVWYMLAMDEGHGFQKKSNRDAQREAETLFFREIFGLERR
jgi:dipeptidyl aminopeptidase/acylaminoacyl peptidase